MLDSEEDEEFHTGSESEGTSYYSLEEEQQERADTKVAASRRELNGSEPAHTRTHTPFDIVKRTKTVKSHLRVVEVKSCVLLLCRFALENFSFMLLWFLRYFNKYIATVARKQAGAGTPALNK